MRAWAWLIASSILSGCASMGKEECQSANWYAVGLEDGARGRPLERLGEHRRACAEHRVAPDPERYVAGRDEGLKTFCTVERGFAHGRAGQSFAPVCPPESAARFASSYQRGRELHDLHRRLGEVQKDIARSKASLKEGIPNARSRAREVERLEDLTRESEQLEGRISQAEGR